MNMGGKETRGGGGRRIEGGGQLEGHKCIRGEHKRGLDSRRRKIKS
jgi:hypothetical protein